MLISSYNQVLVAFSLIVAILASYTALDMAGRVTLAKGREALSWLIGGAFAMGFGIWSMHFVGMLAFSLPIPLGYDLGLTLLSLLLAVGSSAFALWLVCQAELPWQRLALGALLMGSGIAAMHYTGMAALLMMPGIVYDPLWLGLSILIAVIASGAALWIAFRLRHGSRRIVLVRAGAALVMGCAIVGMHYTGMAAAQFPLGSFCGAAGQGIDNGWLAVLVIVITLAVIAIALIVSVLDSRLEARTSVLATSLARANRELIQLALHDNLTKLPNRMLLDDRLEQAIQQAIRDDRRFAVLFMDPRRLQGGQRCLRPSPRRPVADRSRRAYPRQRPRPGHHRPPRRRRVRPADRGPRARRRRDPGREAGEADQPAVPDIPPRGADLGEHRHRALPRRRADPPRTDDQCRRGDVSRQGPGTERLLLLREFDERQRPGTVATAP